MQPLVYLDVVEATWRSWAASSPPTDTALLAAARQILDGCLNPASTKSPLIRR